MERARRELELDGGSGSGVAVRGVHANGVRGPQNENTQHAVKTGTENIQITNKHTRVTTSRCYYKPGYNLF